MAVYKDLTGSRMGEAQALNEHLAYTHPALIPTVTHFGHTQCQLCRVCLDREVLRTTLGCEASMWVPVRARQRCQLSVAWEGNNCFSCVPRPCIFQDRTPPLHLLYIKKNVKLMDPT